MNKKYTTVYLDLDNTILDFNKAEYKAIKALLKLHALPEGDEVAALYSKINRSYWESFERGEIPKEAIFSGRFSTLLESLKCKGNPEKMAEDYFQLLASGHDVMEGAEDILTYLKKCGYILCATTNGVSFTQYRRIAESGIERYFDAVIVSEDAGHQKPEPEYFEYAMANSPEKDKSKILVVGDSQSSDILGGISFGVDTCWFNPEKSTGKYTPTYEIHTLEELKQIL